MSIDLTLPFDRSTSCRGRNRWFQLFRVWIHDSTSQGQPSVNVKFYSNKTGYMPPMMMEITNPEELRTLICGLAKALAQMTQKESPGGSTGPNQ